MIKTITMSLLLIISEVIFAQTNTNTINVNDDTYLIEYPQPGYTGLNMTPCKITKKDKKGQKKYTVDTNIPDKKNGEEYNYLANHVWSDLVGDSIIIIYDVWQNKAKTKNCVLKVFDTKVGKIREPVILFAVKINTIFSLGEIPFMPVYSPDKTKLAVFKDNISPTYNIDAEVKIYDIKTLKELKSKNLGQKHEGQKIVFDENSIKMDNAGNISLIFSFINPKTKITTKSFSANVPYESSGLQDIKELEGNQSTEGGSTDTKSHGHFYKTMQDYFDNKPMPGVRIKSGSFSWSTFGGTKFQLIDDNGNIVKQKVDNLPSDLFTYKRDESSDEFLMRLMDKKPYIILSLGSLCFYSLYEAQSDLYFSEGYNGQLESFKQKKLENYLKQYNLVEAFKKEHPKREFKDSPNSYFNKQVRWWLKYIEILNEKMAK